MRSMALVLALLLPLPVAAAPCLIAVDIGHYRDSPGEISARGVPELTFNAALAHTLSHRLDADSIPHVLINTEGDMAELAARPRLAQRLGASLLLSIHHDSVQDQYKTLWVWQGIERAHSEVFSGFGLFVSGRNPAMAESTLVAAAIADYLLAQGLRPSLHHALADQGENRPLLDGARGLYRFDDLAVLRQASMPAVLVEAGIIVNKDDEALIASEPYRDAFARAMAAAARDHCQRIK